jgi:hypothetical protein
MPDGVVPTLDIVVGVMYDAINNMIFDSWHGSRGDA